MLEPAHASGQLDDPLADVLLSMDEDEDEDLSTIVMVGNTETVAGEVQVDLTTQLPAQLSTQLLALLTIDDKVATANTSMDESSFSASLNVTATTLAPPMLSTVALTQKPTTMKDIKTTTKYPKQSTTFKEPTTAKETATKSSTQAGMSPLSLSSFYPQHAAWEVEIDPQSYNPSQTKPTSSSEVLRSTDRPLASGETKAEAEADIRKKLEELLDHNTRLVDLLRTSLQIQYSLFSRILRTILPFRWTSLLIQCSLFIRILCTILTLE
jgi:hypothetical protein